ncbi:hypothetical protein PAAG_06509 [Paracoccidioides lutzii Pb01]|uniref:Heme peroxidase n=1 Tax=Paracoccidioides lutzii (strain ATCC MYA-826 / Pb01) TaxID=502779 RepID=C1H6W8_PARBA|nr:hypothetical protein PAAG_06509 [Paracoccidioides lutzii Pb01]EEH35462.2 hypothetical protein PAAG_06509 [Paracoccidioides lutzii Pb01]
MRFRCLILIWVLLQTSLCDQWPYHRYYGKKSRSGEFVPDFSRAIQSKGSQHRFIHWLHDVSETQDSGEVRRMFINNTIPRDATSLDEVFDHLKRPEPGNFRGNISHLVPPLIANLPSDEAEKLFGNLKYALDSMCIVDKSNWWYRTTDGSCNWMKKDEINEGRIGMAKARDYGDHHYADGISKLREGPNARAVSNAFFKRNRTIYYEHTPLLIGLIEFVMHDVTYSMDSPEETIEVEMPPDEDTFDKNTKFVVHRTKAVPGTGTSMTNPRENVNMATTWLDISSLYGSTSDVARAVRSYKDGKLLTQEVKAGNMSLATSYLPFNSWNVSMRTTPGLDPTTLFTGGDPRTNEDWLVLAVHTLLLREHNRLCDLLAKQHPEYVDMKNSEHTDEKLYQTVRLLMSAKYALVANSYQMAYWTDKMPWPRDDGFPLYRQMYGESFMEINPMNTYPWPLVTKGGKPMVVSAEMAIVYRFHEFIISQFPIKDAKNNTLWNQSVFDTGFNPQGFLNTGLESILRGMVGSHIPNFKSGVDESFRSAGKYRAGPFDVSTWSIVHEREQGLPTFNTYFREYNKQEPKVTVKVPSTFEEFTSNPEKVQKLKALYDRPDDVDLVVGVQLDETYFPGTTVPKSALIISLFSLFGMGNSDRFSIGFAITRCLLVDQPFDCHPSNALEELLWKPHPEPGLPNMRRLDDFWLNELDFPDHGTNLLWRLVTENTDISCLQQDPLFPADPKTNPVLCSLPTLPWWKIATTAAVSGFEIVETYIEDYHTALVTVMLALGLGMFLQMRSRFLQDKLNIPPVYSGLPLIGEALNFAKDPKGVLLKGFVEYGQTVSRCFGLKLASLVYFVVTRSSDLEWMEADNSKEEIFSLHKFLGVINFPLIVHKENFDSNLHVNIVREYLGNRRVVSKFGTTIMDASNRFIDNSLPHTRTDLSQFVPVLMKYITTVVGACMVGDEIFDHPNLLKIFDQFNDHAIEAMGLSSLLPSRLQILAGVKINADYRKARKILIPIIQKRRGQIGTAESAAKNITLLDQLLKDVPDNERAADLVVILVWGGLTNLQATFPSLIMDIINDPNATRALADTCSLLDPARLSVFDELPRPDPTNPWTPLRAAMFESIRLSGPVTGPARFILKDAQLPSSMPYKTSPQETEPEPEPEPEPAPTAKPQKLPQGQVATLSAYYTHRSPAVYGPDAAKWVPNRFLRSNPDIGSPRFISWGLKGPHTCPGRWFAQECILVMTMCLLGRYDIVPDEYLIDEEKYIYWSSNVERRNVRVTITPRGQSGVDTSVTPMFLRQSTSIYNSFQGTKGGDGKYDISTSVNRMMWG